MVRDGQTYYYHTDALGSVTELTDASGNVVQSYRYDAFGSIVQQSGNINNPFTYTGRELDEDTGLYYYRARYYDASVGRFMSRDPILLDIVQSKHIDKIHEILNSYSYVKNNPINYSDPSGMGPWYDCYSCCVTAALPAWLTTICIAAGAACFVAPIPIICIVEAGCLIWAGWVVIGCGANCMLDPCHCE